jgi:NAD(P)-dependent dehydrogenase (short-subunit alcohol dehydrogenase family)
MNAVSRATARYDFDRRAAIVTGASQGIGRATAERLCADGCSVCLVAAPADANALEDAAEAIRVTTSGTAFAIAGDVSEPATAQRAVEETLQRATRLDYLVSNAGIFYADDLFDAPLEHLDHLLRVNVRGHYLMAVESARAMARSDGGAIVCTASTASLIGEERMTAYNASKGGAAALGRSLAIDLAPYGVRVNVIAPGWVDTPQNWHVRDDPAAWSKHRARVPLDRMAQPEEIAAAIVFLLSDEASYMTGAFVLVDGGATAGFRSSDWDAVTVPTGPRRRLQLD